MTAPTVVLVNGTGYQYGISNDELGINCAHFTLNVKPQFIETLGNIQNVTIVVAYGPMEGDLSIEGEVKGTTGVVGAVLGTAFSPVNSITGNGAPTTGYYLESADIKQQRSAFKMGTWTFKSRGGIP